MFDPFSFPSVLRVAVRLFFVVGIALVIGLGTFSQIRRIDIETPSHFIWIGPWGINFCHLWTPIRHPWKCSFVTPDIPWSMRSLFGSPAVGTGSIALQVIVPWWTLLLTSGLLTAIAWRLTRPKVKGRAFP